MSPEVIQDRVARLMTLAENARTRKPKPGMSDDETVEAIGIGFALIGGLLSNIAVIALALDMIAGQAVNGDGINVNTRGV